MIHGIVLISLPPGVGGGELNRARREASSVGLVSFDLDHFKAVNDKLGHDAGDRTLVRVGEELRAATRDSDVLARMGGEEFVVLVPGGGIVDTRALAERVRIAMDASVDPATSRNRTVVSARSGGSQASRTLSARSR